MATMAPRIGEAKKRIPLGDGASEIPPISRIPLGESTGGGPRF